MRLRPLLIATAICLTTAVALYLSRGVLDRVLTPEGSVRLAMLPAWESLAGFFAVAVMALVGLAHRTRAAHAGAQMAVVDIALPLLALAVLILPYLPWLPDRLPVLQMLAGPSRYLVWALVLTQVGWVFSHEVRHLRLLARLPAPALAALVGVATLAVTGAAAARLTPTTLFPGGDEPHYLVIAQSLWNDGDFKIENNHEQGDYLAYFGRPLDPHYLTRGADGEIYSIHPVGLPVVLAPVYALGGYPLVVTFMLVLAAAAAALMWLWVAGRLGDAAAATFAVAAIVLSPPFALNSFTVYPEVAAALVVVAILTVVPRAGTPATGLVRWLAVGVLGGLLPWLSTKYAPMSAAAMAIALARIWLDGTPILAPEARPQRLLRSFALAGPYLLILTGWFAFFYAFWGTPLPQAPYGALVQTDVRNLVFGAPGLLFDQEYGLLAFAPVYVLAATGLASMWRAGGADRRRAIELAALVVALMGTVGAFRIWWGGSASPGRPMVSGLLLLALPMAVAFRNAPRGSARRAGQYVLLWTGAWLTVLLTEVNGGLLINNSRDGTSHLLAYLSPLWEAWTLAPTFIYHPTATAALHTMVWLLVAGAGAWVLRRARTRTPGGASLTALLTFAGGLLVCAVVMPWLPADPAWPRVDLANRARLTGLDGFDDSALPNAILYDPFRALPSDEAEPRLVLEVGAGRRRDRQPTRVLHNGRFSVPAGRYRVDMTWVTEHPFPAHAEERLGLQFGRLGRAVQTWSLAPSPGGSWHAEIDLPLDAGFLGFTGSTTLERAVSSISLTPVSLVNRSRRERTAQVLAASRYGPAMALFLDTAVYPEATGFWTRGGTTTQVALASDAEEPITLRLHPGPQANSVELSMPGWHRTVELEADTEASVTLPVASRRVVELEIRTARGFVPARLDNSSRDDRELGTWIAIAPPARAAAGQ